MRLIIFEKKFNNFIPHSSNFNKTKILPLFAQNQKVVMKTKFYLEKCLRKHSLLILLTQFRLSSLAMLERTIHKSGHYDIEVSLFPTKELKETQN